VVVVVEAMLVCALLPLALAPALLLALVMHPVHPIRSAARMVAGGLVLHQLAQEEAAALILELAPSTMVPAPATSHAPVTIHALLTRSAARMVAAAIA